MRFIYQYRVKHLRNLLEANQCNDDNRCNHKNRHPRHDLPQTFGGMESTCPVWIRPTENLLTHPRKSFRINELWYNKYDKYKSTINKIRLERRTLWRFQIKQINQLKRKSLNIQPEPSPWPSKNLWWKQICMYGLYTDHRQFSITPKYKFQDQLTMIQSMWKAGQQ